MQNQHSNITHLIEARITMTTNERNVCIQCGNDATFMYVGYEVFTQEQVDTLMEGIASSQTVSEAMKQAKGLGASINTHQATLQEQRQGLPKERRRSYRCLPCMTMVLTIMVGSVHGEVAKLYGPDATLHELIDTPSSAAWIVRELADPDRPCVMQAPFQDVKLAYEALRSDKHIPLIEIAEE